MDALDLDILRAIGVEPFFAGPRDPRPWRPEAVAERVDATPRLVKDRLARLERDGIVGHYELQPNLALLGFASRSYMFRFPTRVHKRDVLRKLKDVDGILAHVDYLSNWMTLGFAYRDEPDARRKLGLIGALVEGAEAVTWFEPPPAPPTVEPTRLDWRIIRAFRGDARRSHQEVADELGVTTKTIQRRLARLAEGNAIDAFVRLQRKSLDEVILCTIRFVVAPGSEAAAMQAIHGELLARAWVHCSAEPFDHGAHWDLVASATTPGGLRELLDRAESVPGVTEVEGHIAIDAAWPTDWLDGEIDRRIAAMAE